MHGESRLTKLQLIELRFKLEIDWYTLSLKFMELAINLTHQRVSRAG